MVGTALGPALELLCSCPSARKRNASFVALVFVWGDAAAVALQKCPVKAQVGETKTFPWQTSAPNPSPSPHICKIRVQTPQILKEFSTRRISTQTLYLTITAYQQDALLRGLPHGADRQKGRDFPSKSHQGWSMPGACRLSAPCKGITASEMLPGAQHQSAKGSSILMGRAWCGGYFAPPHAEGHGEHLTVGVLGWMELVCAHVFTCVHRPMYAPHVRIAACVSCTRGKCTLHAHNGYMHGAHASEVHVGKGWVHPKAF